MQINDISLPEVYKESQDFRFFCTWFENALQQTKYDIENLYDCYDPLRCKNELVWMLADTMGYVYDDRLPMSFNRLVLLYFMSMIYNRGGRDGLILAAQVNLAQFKILLEASGYTDSYGVVHEPVETALDRLDDPSIPVYSVSVTPHPESGYIDLVYFSTDIPIDACTEYVRPVGMFLFQNKGVRMDANTKIYVDARLTDTKDMKMSIGPTFVGHYSRNDYARLQRTVGEFIADDSRNPVWYRNSVSEAAPNLDIHPGYRSLMSLQLSNNEEVMRSLISPIFSLGFKPQDVYTTFPDNYLKIPDPPNWNLRYDFVTDVLNTPQSTDGDLSVSTVDPDRTTDIMNPRPAVNPPMTKLGDSMSE